MRWLGYIFLCLLVIGGLCCLVVFGIGRYMRRRCIAVGLLEHQPSRKPIRGYLWLADREMEQYLSEQKRQGSE